MTPVMYIANSTKGTSKAAKTSPDESSEVPLPLLEVGSSADKLDDRLGEMAVVDMRVHVGIAIRKEVIHIQA
ncbi:hypothetical protein A0H81_12237 [Grifola frondosa]|uniref:Uncharacterized protein n=1 Tax=Grifola frondosa TaxID=5627 RepID=A0A1C7LTJ8_GRIFR|nr:hypothetical protein A0H81_12237 [Grifola frondosa]